MKDLQALVALVDKFCKLAVFVYDGLPFDEPIEGLEPDPEKPEYPDVDPGSLPIEGYKFSPVPETTSKPSKPTYKRKVETPEGVQSEDDLTPEEAGTLSMSLNQMMGSMPKDMLDKHLERFIDLQKKLTHIQRGTSEEEHGPTTERAPEPQQTP